MTDLRVLHVEDDPDIREVVEISLGLDSEIALQSCGSGQEALAVVPVWLPDIILLDVMMPGMDGPATLARLRDSDHTAEIPVVFLTALSQTHEIDRFRALGAAGVVCKPFDPVTLAVSVRGYVRPANGRCDATPGPFLHVSLGFQRRVKDDAVTLARHRAGIWHDTASPLALAAIRDIAHCLAGAGGIFGRPDISAAAAALEEAIVTRHDGSFDEIMRALDQLLACVEPRMADPREPPHSQPIA